MRWIFFLICLLPLTHALAEGAVSPQRIRQAIEMHLVPVDPAAPRPIEFFVESLAALGKDSLPVMREVYDEYCGKLADAEAENRPEVIPRLQMQVQVLDQAIIRLETGFNWPQLIRLWVKQQYKPEQQGIADTLPEPVRITDPQVANAFPGYLFYISRFRQYPVARMIPEPLAANNLFAVKREMPAFIGGQFPPPGQVTLITDIDELKGFFLAHWTIGRVAGSIENVMKDATYSWLRMSEELHNDGFFRFVIRPESLRVAASGANEGGYRVSGRADVLPAGASSGAITATLTFDGGTRLTQIKEEARLQPGTRPICQATKLLDPDPIVRKMAEQDLLIMGPAAYDYLMTERAKATPDLQAAIDVIWKRIVERAAQ